ncbi:MAG: pilus assembly protein [Proteobacteria bacterium]|nr:MAG: pilus assembly protein [Pseudomonadota bacterium]
MQQGFTLIELLTVMAIVAILAAISIPQYSTFRRRAFDARALSDLRNVATAEEAYFIDAERYLSCVNQNCTVLPGLSALSKGVSLSVAANQQSFTAQAKHAQGSPQPFRWDSERGGLQE